MITKPLTAIIVDDEPLALEGLRLRLEKIPAVKVIGEASDGDAAIALCHELTPDVMFLDLNLPGLNGIEVVQSIQGDVLPLVVFVSAYGEYALDAFEVNAIDYVLKPASITRLQQSIDKILERFEAKDQSQDKYRLLKALGKVSGFCEAELEDWLKSDNPLPSKYKQDLVIKNSQGEKLFLATSEIRWIEAAGDYMCIHTGQETHVIRSTLKKLVSQLDPSIFIRIHKSTLVNVRLIKSLKPLRNSECIIDLGNHISLKVSRNFSSNIKKIVEDLSI